MAGNSLLSFKSSSPLNQLRSNYSFLNVRKLIPSSPPIAFSSPSTLRRRRLIISEMESSKTESGPQLFHDEDAKFRSISCSVQNSLAPTIVDSGQNLQLISLANIPTWAKLALGSIVLLAIPFCRKVFKIKDVIKTVEEVAEVVEMVAEATEKVVEGIAEALPDGSNLKEAAIKLEKIAFLVDKQAEITESLITKVDDAVQVFDATLKPLIDGEVKVNGDSNKIISDFNIKLSKKSSVKR